MKPVYFVLLPDGEREGPYDEEELLDLMDAGEFGRQTVVEEERSRKRSKLGELFQVIADPGNPGASPAPARTAPASDQDEEEIEDEEGDVDGEDEEPEEEEDEEDEADEDDSDPGLMQEKRAWQPAPLPGFTGTGTAPVRPLAASQSPAREHPEHAPLRILYAGGPSILNYWRGLTLCTAVIAGGWFGGRYDPGYVIGGLVLGTVLLLGILARRSSVDYIVSTRRVELREGLVSQSSREIRIQDIRSINVEKPGLLGLFGVGDVEFSSSAAEGSDILFRGVWRAARLRMLVRRLQDRGG